MATEDKLKKYVTAIADAIRAKEGSTELINPQDFVDRINALSIGGGATINNQDKVVGITENGTTEVVADSGFTGLGKVSVNVDVKGGDSTQEAKWGAGIHVISFFEKDPLGGDGTYYLYGFHLDSDVDTDFTWHTLIEDPSSISLYYVSIPNNTAPTIKDGYVYYDDYPVYHDLEDNGWMGSTFINHVKASDIVEKGKIYYIDKGNGA